MSAGRVVAIRRVGDCIYTVDIADMAGVLRTYEFQVLTEPIPTVVRSGVFYADVGESGRLTRPGQEILSIVLAFHHLAQSEISINPDNALP